MPRVTITIFDDGFDGEKPHVGVELRSEPDMPITAAGEPDIDSMSAAQVSAYGLLIGLAGQAGASRMFTQVGETLTEIDTGET